ncbi:MAG: hypothetical protein JW937_08320 [Candidatus Omnitrophica bacterium]|nr:hypothetical protein [Candidatus Omnitrophota bacterium]
MAFSLSACETLKAGRDRYEADKRQEALGESVRRDLWEIAKGMGRDIKGVGGLFGQGVRRVGVGAGKTGRAIEKTLAPEPTKNWE